MNKVMAAAGRRELRDILDLVTIHETILTLGPLIWAAVEKAPGFTPEGLIAEIRRNSNYSASEWRALSSSEPLEPKDIMARLRTALDEAAAFVARMPTEKLAYARCRMTNASPRRVARCSSRTSLRSYRRARCIITRLSYITRSYCRHFWTCTNSR